MTTKIPLSLKAIAEAKAKLSQELQGLDQQEAQLRQQEAMNAFDKVIALLRDYRLAFSAKQKSDIAALIAADKPKAKSASPKKEIPPKYWLPHSGETWTGRGRPPRAFTIWEGSASYKEWKAKHPNEKFPKYPG
jgi:DNA-binding protein H-NS